MKKIIFLILTTLAIVSCDNRTEAEIKEVEHLDGFNIIIVDSCEYLIKREIISIQASSIQGYGYFAHKGNCRFCKERREREERYESK